MVRINYQELEFEHIVEFTRDNTVFAAARENGTGHLRLFLIDEATSNVYSRNGPKSSWEKLSGDDCESVIARLSDARSNHTAVYKINGASGPL